MAGLDAETSSRSEYEVFLSFRGPDTRIGFTDVLYHSLLDAGIFAFRDDEELHVGERIDGSLLQAINDSMIYIPIFSQTYASSQWCLHELSQIVEKTSKSEGSKEILPIFFDVTPDDVKLRTPLYRDAILNLEYMSKLNEEVDAWREALKKVDVRKGWEVKNYKGHGELILLIVSEVSEKLKKNHNLVIERLVGINDQVEAIIKWLNVDSDGVRLIKIHGMGGIGKTTLTKVIFESLSSHFGKFCCFLEDVRANSSRRNGLVELQKKLLLEIGYPTSSWRSDEIDYGMEKIEAALCDKKVLIVLDDVDNSEQVEKLVGNNILNSGSRILISTRNKDVLRTNRSEYEILEYEMEVMGYDHAFELFNWHAFHNDSPSDDYIDLSREIISTTGRLPLALKVIGSFLYQKRQYQWKMTLDKLRKAPLKDVFAKLKISYDALSYRQKQIFLDIACFLIGEDVTNALYMWTDCEFFPTSGVAVLIKLSLVKILRNNTFWMHDQLRDIGREIVRQESPENPREWSRIWTSGEVLDATKTKKMNRNVQALSFDSYAQNFEDHIVLSKEIGRFEHLRFLKLLGGTFAGDLADCLPNLRWISWYFPQRIYKWTNMYLKNIVILEFTGVDLLDDSRLRDIIESARKLKVFSLKSCHSIMTTPNFSKCPSLERLTFEDCSNLSRIDGSIGELRHLIDLKIDKCSCLKDLPEEIGDLMRLKHFFVQRCPVKKLPDSIWKLKSIHEMHFSSSCFALVSTDSWELPSAIEKLENLEVLIVNSLNLTGQLPSWIGILPILRILNLSNTQVNEVPKTIGMLSQLQVLELMACHNIQELPALPTSLTHLRVSSASLRAIPNLSNLTNLVQLDLIIMNKEEINSVSMGDGVLRVYSS